MITKDKPWQRLADTLRLRRNLQSAATPPELIGSMGGYGNSWNSEEANRAALMESRARHREWSVDLKKGLGIRTMKQLSAKIAELMEAEERLWKQCRPDLYGN